MKTKYKVTFAIIAILAIASWIITFYYWDKLPAVIPIHFGISGAADGWADKSVWQVFSIPFIQTAMLALFIFVYKRPQYSNIPSTMWLMALNDKQQQQAYDLIRTLNAGVSVFTGALFTYITFSMNYSAISFNQNLSSPVILAVVGLMLVWVVYWTVKIYKITKKQITSK